jgi:PTS system galactitol-specific IIC component
MSVFKTIISLGPSVMMPIIFIILALIFGVKLGKAFKSGMLVGIGFVGINLVIGLLLDSLGPAAQTMVQKFGLHLTVIDAGWPVGSSIGWGSPIVPIVVFGGLIINIILLIFNLTKTVDIDIFNYWHFLLTGAVIYAITNNVFIGSAGALIDFLITLFIADRTAPKIQEAYNLKGVSFPHATSAMYAPVGIIVNWIIERIPGLRSIDANPDNTWGLAWNTCRMEYTGNNESCSKNGCCYDIASCYGKCSCTRTYNSKGCSRNQTQKEIP